MMGPRSKKFFLIGVIVAMCGFALGAMSTEETTVEMILANVTEVNTPGDDFFPSITADGSTMVFSVKPADSDNSDIYISHFKDGKWTTARPIEELNTQYDEQTPYISQDGEMLIFSSNREGAIRPPKNQGPVYYLTNDLYISFLENGKWTAPKWLEGEINTADNERAPSLSKDGKTIYFSRYSGNDIYSSKIYSATLDGIMTSKVTLMPRPINSDYSDFGLMPSNSKPGFYFSSNRPGGMGLWDIYFVSFINEEFGEPVNLGPPINSKSNDLSITELGNKIYFCSDRKGGIGNSDIYAIAISTKVLKLPDTGFIISVVDAKSKNPIVASLEISVYSGDDAKEEIKKVVIESNAEGRCELKTDYYAKKIIVVPFDAGYKSDAMSFDVSAGEMRRVTVELAEAEKKTDESIAVLQKKDESPSDKIEKQILREWSFQPIYFEYKSYELSKEAWQRMWNIKKLLESEKNIRLTIIGHTDFKGSDSYNLKLGYQRARAVKNGLMKNGLKAEYELVSKGKRQPSELYKKTRQQKYNRRVEITAKEYVPEDQK